MIFYPRISDCSCIVVEVVFTKAKSGIKSRKISLFVGIDPSKRVRCFLSTLESGSFHNANYVVFTKCCIIHTKKGGIRNEIHFWEHYDSEFVLH